MDQKAPRIAFEPKVRNLPKETSLVLLGELQLTRGEKGAAEAEALARQALEVAPENARAMLLLAGALVLSFFVLVFTELQRKARGLINVEPQEAVKLINADAVVIDLRSPEAFARGHIVNAKNLPFDELPANKNKITKYAKKTIVAVCDAGTTSNKVVDSLRKSGIENVFGLKGGINAWTQANLPLVTGKKTKKKA